MTRRLSTLLALALLALLAAGCGNKSEVRTLGKTEGIYVDVDGLSYQIQLSRILNPNDLEDKNYLKGLAPTVAQTAKDESWFGVFLRVNNPSGVPKLSTDRFSMVDTQGNTFVPTQVDNPFAYQPKRLIPNEIYPDANSLQGEGQIQGALVLFKVKNAALSNRPIELQIAAPGSGGGKAAIDLDI
jgi:hypothetical protein